MKPTQILVLITFFVVGFWTGAAWGLDTVGRGVTQEQAVTNSHVAAHFACNRKGLWADLDSLKVTKINRKQYKLPGGRRSVTSYETEVKFDCTPDYARFPSAE